MDNEEATPTRITQALHEPVTPYFAAAYTTLMSIVQGVALAMLAYVLFQQSLPPGMSWWVIVTKATISSLVIGIVWHSYITLIQLGCWRLTILDTVIPIGFAVLECWVIISVPRSMFQFSLALAVTAIWGFFTFLNSELHSRTIGWGLFEEHFGEQEFAHQLFSLLRAYHNSAADLDGHYVGDLRDLRGCRENHPSGWHKHNFYRACLFDCHSYGFLALRTKKLAQ